MITATKFAVNSGAPDVSFGDFDGALLPVPGASRDMIGWGPLEVAEASRDAIGWGPVEELDGDTAATLHKSVRQQLNVQAGADLFICAQAAKWNKTFAMIA